MPRWCVVGRGAGTTRGCALVLLALTAASCGAHRITSNPSGALVLGFWGGEDAKPKPEDMNPWQTTPFTFGGGPFGHWYQVRKDNYADSEIIFLSSNVWSGVKSHHFDLKPLLPAAQPIQVGIILAVFDIEDATQQLKEQEINQIQEFLETRLTELGGFKIVPREQLRQRLQQEKTDSYRACFDEACQIELGKEVAAAKSLATRILKVGGTCVVTSKLFDLKTATSEKAASVRVACSPEGLLDGMDQIAKQLSTP